MQYFANPSTPKVRDAMMTGRLSVIETPKQGNRAVEGAAWCADNGCFGKGYPGDAEWFAWLERNADRSDSCLFATAPDVVGDADATIERSRPWLPKIRALGYPAAFVAQDGLMCWGGVDGPLVTYGFQSSIAWQEFDVLFIGGSTEWKLGAHARVIVAGAKRRGKRVHMGRVNSLKRLRYAVSIGCDSADGTFIAFGPDKNLSKMLDWLAVVRAERPLFDYAAPSIPPETGADS